MKRKKKKTTLTQRDLEALAAIVVGAQQGGPKEADTKAEDDEDGRLILSSPAEAIALASGYAVAASSVLDTGTDEDASVAALRVSLGEGERLLRRALRQIERARESLEEEVA